MILSCIIHFHQPFINDWQPFIAILALGCASGQYDYVGLPIIDVGLLKMYNALQNHVIVITQHLKLLPLIIHGPTLYSENNGLWQLRYHCDTLD